MNSQLLDHITRALPQDLAEAADTCQLKPVAGGDINTSYLLTCAEQRFFVKTLSHSQAQSMHQTEAQSLKALAQNTAIAVPKVIGEGSCASTSFLILQALTLDGPRNWQALGSGLAQLHSFSAAQFGWPQNNFIGTTVQVNRQHECWSDFWWQERMLPQLQLAYNIGYGTKLQPQEQKLHEACNRLLANHQPQVSLVHGDLWGGNIGFLPNGQPAVFDPACYYGDREVDIAMSQLFGGFGDDFYRAYDADWPLTNGYEQRAVLYNLYHLLNHLNLFGSGYLNQCLSSIQRLSQ